MIETSGEYGKLPVDLGEIDISTNETMNYLYLPIKMANVNGVRVESRLIDILYPFVKEIYADLGQEFLFDKYIYATVKHCFVSPEVSSNRGGRHGDGFLSDDLNYIWYDSFPTLFAHQEFDVTPDHNMSMEEFEKQVKPENIFVFPCKRLLKLDQYVIHCVKPIDKPTMRTFIKISVSKEKYNLIGNTHNYEFNYDWKMYERNEVRNHPSHPQEVDYFNPNSQ